jgi:hypothetical protein
MIGAPALAGHRGVAPCARSLTHVRVRSLTCSEAPCADLAMPGATDSSVPQINADVPGAPVR